MIVLFALLIFLVTISYYTFKARKTKEATVVLPPPSLGLLSSHVRFYQQLSDVQKKEFEARITDFLSNTTITGIGTTVTELDKVLVGASAIIPIFAFKGWRYNNIDEVLLYKDAFNDTYAQSGTGRNILGMVGDGAMHRQMILSQPALRAGFQTDDAHNTGIHEFVHLLDKADGATDGVPEYLLSKPYIIPWVKEIREQIAELRQEGRSDIDLYAASNEQEFFAVVSEYFFEQPHRLQEKHPELYALLEQIFKTDTVVKR